MNGDVVDLNLVRQRERYFADPSTSVSVRVEPRSTVYRGVSSPDDVMTLTAWFECMTCGEELGHVPMRRIYDCPGCGYELSEREAVALCEMYRHCIQQLSIAAGEIVKMKRGFFLWRWLKLLGVGTKAPTA